MKCLQLDIVLASFKGYESFYDSFSLLKNYNVRVFAYERRKHILNNKITKDFSIIKSFEKSDGCRFTAFDVYMHSNYGKDGSPFYHYAYYGEYRNSDSLVYLHGNVLNDWHSDCYTTFQRIEFYLREKPKIMMSLTGIANFFDWYGNRTYVLPENKWRNNQHHTWNFTNDEIVVTPRRQTIFDRHKITLKRNNYGACCGTFIMPIERLFLYPHSFYLEMFNEIMNKKINHESSARIYYEFIIYQLFGDVYNHNYLKEFYDAAYRVTSTIGKNACIVRS